MKKHKSSAFRLIHQKNQITQSQFSEIHLTKQAIYQRLLAAIGFQNNPRLSALLPAPQSLARGRKGHRRHPSLCHGTQPPLPLSTLVHHPHLQPQGNEWLQNAANLKLQKRHPKWFSLCVDLRGHQFLVPIQQRGPSSSAVRWEYVTSSG